MAISLVASPISNSAIDGGNVTLDLTTITGLAQNDVVLVYGAVSRAQQGGTTSTGWTLLQTLDQLTVRGTVWRKVMGATPDTSFAFTGTANTQDVGIVQARAYRGVDTTTPEDATATKVGGTSTNPDPPAITTVTNNAMVVAFAASRGDDTTINEPSGYGNVHTKREADTRVLVMSSADLTKATAGAENPASWTNWVTGDWAAFTVALRPASSGAYTIAASAGSYAVTGTAATLKLGRLIGATSGSYALTGQTATLRRNLPITAGVGSYSISGTAVTLRHTYVTPAAAGSYSINGTAVSLKRGFQLTALSGNYGFSGAAAELKVGRNISALSGAYSVTGQSATLIYATLSGTYTIVADPGVYALNGASAALNLAPAIVPPVLVAPNPGGSPRSGRTYRWKRVREPVRARMLIAAEPGAYLISGSPADLLYDPMHQHIENDNALILALIS